MALTDNLISYWALDEASGNATDSHGSNTLTDNNTVTSATGIINNARSFASASSEYLSHTDNSDLSTGDIDFSFSLWIYLATKPGTNMYALAKAPSDGSTGGTEYGILYRASTDRLAFFTGGSATAIVDANTLGSPSTSTWYYVYVQHDAAANQIGISINAGTLDTAAESTISDTANGFSMGRFGDFNGLYWNGRVDECGFWKRTLTSGERTSLYNGGAGLAYPFSGGGGGGAATGFINLPLLGVG